MKHHQENVNLLAGMLSRIFNKVFLNIRYEAGEDQIVIGDTGFVIYETQTAVKRIGGIEMIVPAYGLGQEQVKYFRPDDEPVGEFAELAVERVFTQIAKAAAIALCEQLADAQIERLDCEAQAKELFG